MPNLSQLFRDEISRISRREGRKQTALLQRSSAQYRRDIAALKRQVAALQKEIKFVRRQKNSVPTNTNQGETAAGSRFVAKGFRSLRHRLGLSAGQMGKLLDVSEQSIYNWETKIAAPRRTHMPAIAKLRGLGKREAQRLLEKR